MNSNSERAAKNFCRAISKLQIEWSFAKTAKSRIAFGARARAACNEYLRNRVPAPYERQMQQADNVFHKVLEIAILDSNGMGNRSRGQHFRSLEKKLDRLPSEWLCYRLQSAR